VQTDSFGKLLPRILFPYAQQWAERSGMTLLSRLLVDEQFREVIERYGDELLTRMAQANRATGNGNGRADVSSSAMGRRAGGHADTADSDLAGLRDRVLAMEAQQEAHQALFESLRSKIRPIALALGCCPECFVGVEGCPKCWGRSRVAHYQPDYTLLETQVVNPLAARGIPLALKKSKGHQSREESSATTDRSKPWPKK
jgi:hypothetical protein